MPQPRAAITAGGLRRVGSVLYREYRALCDSMLAALPIPVLSHHKNGDWQRIYTAILAFLGMPCETAAPLTQ